MNGRKLRLALAGVLGVSLTALSPPAVLAASEHDNYVYFDVQGLSSFSFNTTGYSITASQPYGGTSSGTTQETGHQQAFILVKAGRKNSSSVAAWFKKQAGSGQTLACDSSGTYPNELNFAVQGTMQITTATNKQVICDNIIVAQGHFGLNNNWWLASPTMGGVHVTITGATAQWCSMNKKPVIVAFTPKTPCVSHFSIAIIDPP